MEPRPELVKNPALKPNQIHTNSSIIEQLNFIKSLSKKKFSVLSFLKSAYSQHAKPIEALQSLSYLQKIKSVGLISSKQPLSGLIYHISVPMREYDHRILINQDITGQKKQSEQYSIYLPNTYVAHNGISKPIHKRLILCKKTKNNTLEQINEVILKKPLKFGSLQWKDTSIAFTLEGSTSQEKFAQHWLFNHFHPDFDEIFKKYKIEKPKLTPDLISFFENNISKRL